MLRLIILLTGLLFAIPLLAEDRTALVIGNSGYKIGYLKNPVNDAISIAAKLRAMDFKVELVTDANRKTMVQKIRHWGGNLRRNTVALFYYAGHGVQLGEENYLLPVNINIQNETDFEFEGVALSEVLRLMGDAQNYANIVILDACRNNPYRNKYRSFSRGLKRVDGPTGTIIAYSTSPGATADDGDGANGLYTTYLLKAMQQPGRPIEFVFKDVAARVKAVTSGKQIPWYSAGSFTGEFYFVPGANNKKSTTSTNESEISIELQYWQEVKKANSQAMYRAYLSEYPNGKFVELAKLYLKNTNKPAEVKAKTVDEETAYRQAMKTLRSTEFHKATNEFKQFIKTYPSGSHIAEAHYWLAYSYYSSSQYDQAIQEYDLVVSQFPESEKVPSALLKIGDILQKKGDYRKARLIYNQVIKYFPHRSESNIARRKVTEIFSEGR
ncbi:MAG: tol-pal system protein YbgF [Gammaproteobacteria bacterium]|nr:tol-pal system protein YbgF [Gammaproteobacteria bacterium]